MKLENMTGVQCKAVKHIANMIFRSYIDSLTKHGDVHECIEILKRVDRSVLAQLLVATLKASGKIQDSDCDVELLEDLSQYIDFHLPDYFHTQCVKKESKTKMSLTECHKQIGFHNEINIKRHIEQRDAVFKHLLATEKQQKFLQNLAKRNGLVLLKPLNQYTMYEVNQVSECISGNVARTMISTLIA